MTMVTMVRLCYAFETFKIGSISEVLISEDIQGKVIKEMGEY